MDELIRLRKSIDLVDAKILALIGERLRLVRRVRRFKKAHGLSIRDPKREGEIVKKNIAAGEKLEMSPTFVEKIWKLFFREAYQHEQ